MANTRDLSRLIQRLNPVGRTALEAAAAKCVTLGHVEVTIEHLLHTLLDQPGSDLRVILATFDIPSHILSEEVEQCFRRFRTLDREGTPPVFSPLLLELLEDAWLVTSLKLSEQLISGSAILIAILENPGRYADFQYCGTLEKIPLERFKAERNELVAGSIEHGQSVESGEAVQTQGSEQDALSKYGRNLTELARQGDIDPVFGRDPEIRKIVEVLSRRRKNNPICVGAPGVGKTALAEGIALRIAEGDVPEHLSNVELWSLDLGLLQAGASVKGAFEQRLTDVINAVKSSPIPKILFIDEAHTVIGAGGQQGGSDAANLLKPALARGELRTIAATTWSEYKKYFEKDAALARRFQLVALKEPSVEECVAILRGLRERYEADHKVYITDAGLEAAAHLSARYVTGRQLPDKAIDVLDTSCARVRASADMAPARLDQLQDQLRILERKRASIVRDKDVGLFNADAAAELEALEAQLVDIRDKLSKLTDSYIAQCAVADHFRAVRDRALEPELAVEDGANPPDDDMPKSLTSLRFELTQKQDRERLVSVEVGAEEVADVVSDWTGIPASDLSADEAVKLLNFPAHMKSQIFGQDEAIDVIGKRLQAARLGLQKEEEPRGVFMLAGPSGVGKTETALETARFLFGGSEFLTTINMTEYQERHTVSRLIGSPPGYVGYGEGGVLTEAIRQKPYSVVLLDEIEKADVNVLNLFYQAFDKGIINDGEGQEIDCRNVVFFLTTNLGSDQIENWCDVEEGETAPSTERMANSLKAIFADHLKPALLARMQVIVYRALSDAILGRIVNAKIAALGERIETQQGVTMTVSDAARNHVQGLCKQGSSGARIVEQVVQKVMLPPIAMEILEASRDECVLKRVEIDLVGTGEGETPSLAFAFAEEESAPMSEDIEAQPSALSGADANGDDAMSADLEPEVA